MTAQRRILVTGASGQDGSYLIERLVAEGSEIHAVTREPGASSDGTTRHICDLGDPAQISRLIADVEPEVVFNLAGISSVAFSWQKPIETVQVSGLAVVALLEACHALQERTGHAVRVVQASSSEIFGAAEHSPQVESTPIRPLSPYGAAKALAHNSVGVYRARDLFCSSAILYNHESPRRPDTFVTRKITQGAARIAAGLDRTLSLGNLDARRDWGWAPDYVDAMVRMSRADQPGDFVIATGETHAVRDFVAAAFLRAGIADWQSRVDIDPRFLRPADVHEMRGDPSKARDTLGWSPTRTFSDVVNAMVDYDLALLDS